LFFLSLAVHLFYLAQIEDNVFFYKPVLDSANYYKKALQILAGKETAEGVLTYNPLYPVILSILYRFVEEPGFYAVRVIQSVLGALNCLLILILGLRYFSLRTGLLAAAAAILYAPLLFFDGELIQTAWVVFFLLLAFAILPLAPEGKGAARRLLILLAGIFFGLGMLGRPNLLPFLIFF
jgi:4-amino-4-deoxy-L-arabinose transferase-like glycosyltransferase